MRSSFGSGPNKSIIRRRQVLSSISNWVWGGGGSGIAYTSIMADGEIDALNRWVIVAFDPDVFSLVGGPIVASDLQINFEQNGGVATACAITSITNTSGGALVGGENLVRVNISFTGAPSGVETIQIQAVAQGVYKNSNDELNVAGDSTQVITVPEELDPLYKAGLLLTEAGGFDIPPSPQILIDDALFKDLRAIGWLTTRDAIFLGTYDLEFAKINFMTGTKPATISGSPVITQYEGIKGNTSSDGYINFGISFASGSNFTQNNAQFAAIVFNNAQNNQAIGGARGDGAAATNQGHTRITPRSAADAASVNINGGTSGSSASVASTDSEGVHIVDRNASNDVKYYQNGVEIGSGTNVTVARSTVNVYGNTLNVNNGVPTINTEHKVMLWAWGSSDRTNQATVSGYLNTWKDDLSSISSNAGKLYALAGQSNLIGLVDPSTLPAYLQGQYSVANGKPANCYVWQGSAWEILEPGVNGSALNNASPVFSFAYAESQKYPGENLYFLVRAASGTDLYTSWSEGGAQYNGFMSAYASVISALNVSSFEAFVWYQGEADARDLTKANAYEVKEQDFMADIRANTGFVTVVVANINSSLPGDYPYATTVRAAKTANNTAITDYELIETNDLGYIDNVHLNLSGIITCGERMSAAF